MRASDYEILYDLPEGEYDGRGVEGVRTTSIRAGRSMELMIHPKAEITEGLKREVKRRKSTPAMEKINARNRERAMMRLIEANFTEAAVVSTLTYAYPVEDYGMMNLAELAETYLKRGLPWDYVDAKREMRNMLERLKRRVVKAGGKPSDLKWNVVTEEGEKEPVPGLPRKLHHHCIFEGPGITPEVVEECWRAGRSQNARFDLENDGAARLARYFTKQKRGGRWWTHSRNLKKPVPVVSDRKISRRRLMLLAADIQKNGREILEKLYPDYKVVELPDVKYSDFLPGAYIYVRMRKKGGGGMPWERARIRN